MSQPFVLSYTGFRVFRAPGVDGSPDLCAKVQFFPPKGSDELFAALKNAFPEIKTHKERKMRAVIEFHLQEQREMGQASNWSPTNQSVDYPSPDSSFVATSSSAGVSPPSLSRFDSSSVATPSTPAASSFGAFSNETPTMHGMTSVWSAAEGPAPKIHTRRTMTQQEKQEYRARRQMKACDKCRQRKRKCRHEGGAEPATQPKARGSASSKKARKSNSSPSTGAGAACQTQFEVAPSLFDPISSFPTSQFPSQEMDQLLSNTPEMDNTFGSSAEFDSLGIDAFTSMPDLPSFHDAGLPNFDLDFELMDPAPFANDHWAPEHVDYNFNYTGSGPPPQQHSPSSQPTTLPSTSAPLSSDQTIAETGSPAKHSSGGLVSHLAFDTARSPLLPTGNGQNTHFALEDYLYLEEDPGTRKRSRVQQGPLTPDSLGSSRFSPQALPAGSGISSSSSADDLAATGMYGLDRLYDLHEGDGARDLTDSLATSQDVKKSGRATAGSLRPSIGQQIRLGGSNPEEFRFTTPSNHHGSAEGINSATVLADGMERRGPRLFDVAQNPAHDLLQVLQGDNQQNTGFLPSDKEERTRKLEAVVAKTFAGRGHQLGGLQEYQAALLASLAKTEASPFLSSSGAMHPTPTASATPEVWLTQLSRLLATFTFLYPRVLSFAALSSARGISYFLGTGVLSSFAAHFEAVFRIDEGVQRLLATRRDGIATPASLIHILYLWIDYVDRANWVLLSVMMRMQSQESRREDTARPTMPSRTQDKRCDQAVAFAPQPQHTKHAHEGLGEGKDVQWSMATEYLTWSSSRVWSTRLVDLTVERLRLLSRRSARSTKAVPWSLDSAAGGMQSGPPVLQATSNKRLASAVRKNLASSVGSKPDMAFDFLHSAAAGRIYGTAIVAMCLCLLMAAVSTFSASLSSCVGAVVSAAARKDDGIGRWVAAAVCAGVVPMKPARNLVMT